LFLAILKKEAIKKMASEQSVDIAKVEEFCNLQIREAEQALK
jgi:hypothetical protein